MAISLLFGAPLPLDEALDWIYQESKPRLIMEHFHELYEACVMALPETGIRGRVGYILMNTVEAVLKEDQQEGSLILKAFQDGPELVEMLGRNKSQEARELWEKKFAELLAQRGKEGKK